MSVSCFDFLIIGGGVTGLTTGLRLAEQGGTVAVLDRGQIGQEASWAGAGMLPPGNLDLASDAESRLRGYSHALWHDFASDLRDRSGLDTGYRICGCLEINETDSPTSLNGIRDQLSREQIAFRNLTSPEDVVSCVPEIDRQHTEGVFVPGFGQVRNPRHLKALLAACTQSGVRIIENVEALSLIRSGQEVIVRSHQHEYHAGQILMAAGAWSGVLLEQLKLKFSIPIFPVRGQIVQLRKLPLPFRCVIQQGRRYLVPRPDGLILVGSTEEHCGFEKTTTAEAVEGLLLFARSVVPTLGDAEVVRSWAGLRPGTTDELPLLGRIEDFSNLTIAAGHFRSGLQMSVGTSSIAADLMMGRKPAISLEGLSPDRFGAASNPGPQSAPSTFPSASAGRP